MNTFNPKDITLVCLTDGNPDKSYDFWPEPFSMLDLSELSYSQKQCFSLSRIYYYFIRSLDNPKSLTNQTLQKMIKSYQRYGKLRLFYFSDDLDFTNDIHSYIVLKLNSEIRNKILVNLKKVLNGKCSSLDQSCPKNISYRLKYKQLWSCSDCYNNFNWLSSSGQAKSDTDYRVICPCSYVKNYELIEARIDEIINNPETFIY